MASETEYTAQPQSRAIPSNESSNTLRSFPPAATSDGGDPPVAQTAEFDEAAWMEPSLAGQTSIASGAQQAATMRPIPDEPLEEDVRASRRRHWPAVVAFVVAGSFVSLIGIGVVKRVTLLGVADEGQAMLRSAHERKPEPRPQQMDPVAIAKPLDAPPEARKPLPAQTNGSSLGTPGLSKSPEPESEEIRATKSVAPTARKNAPVDNLPQARTSVHRRASRDSRRAVWSRPAEPEQGINVSDVYINARGELVDAQGKPLK